jgi:hypothetical protein
MSIILNFESTSLGTNVNPADFTVAFPRAVELEGVWEIGLLSAAIWYSYYNISSQYANTTLRYYNGTAWRTVTIQPGTYQLTDINTYLQTTMQTNGDYTTDSNGDPVYHVSITANYNTGCAIVTLSNNYELDLSVSNLNSLLGFPSEIISTQGATEGPNPVDITNGINCLYIHNSLVDQSYINGNGTSDIVYSFVPTSPPFSLITIQPVKIVFIPLTRKILDQMRVYLTDNQNRPINLNSQPTTYTFILRRNKEYLALNQTKVLSEGFKNMQNPQKR